MPDARMVSSIPRFISSGCRHLCPSMEMRQQNKLSDVISVEDELSASTAANPDVSYASSRHPLLISSSLHTIKILQVIV